MSNQKVLSSVNEDSIGEKLLSMLFCKIFLLKIWVNIHNQTKCKEFFE